MKKILFIAVLSAFSLCAFSQRESGIRETIRETILESQRQSERSRQQFWQQQHEREMQHREQMRQDQINRQRQQDQINWQRQQEQNRLLQEDRARRQQAIGALSLPQGVARLTTRYLFYFESERFYGNIVTFQISNSNGIINISGDWIDSSSREFRIVSREEGYDSEFGRFYLFLVGVSNSPNPPSHFFTITNSFITFSRIDGSARGAYLFER